MGQIVIRLYLIICLNNQILQLEYKKPLKTAVSMPGQEKK